MIYSVYIRHRYEKGDIEKMPLSVLEPIAKILGCSPAYLMGWTDNPDPNLIVTTPIFQDTISKLLAKIPTGHINLPDDAYDDDEEEEDSDKEDSTLEFEDIGKAFDLYKLYKNASPRDRSIVDSLLKPDKPDS